MSIDFTYSSTMVNAKYIDALGGEATFTIVGAELYTTQDGKELKCLQLSHNDDDVILFPPNATNTLVLNNAGLRKSEEMLGYQLILHTVPVSFGNEERKGVRIKEVLMPEQDQEVL